MGNGAIALRVTMQRAPEQLTPPAQQRRPADNDLASAKANGINMGHGAFAMWAKVLSQQGQ